jgi:hypothetical protein
LDPLLLVILMLAGAFLLAALSYGAEAARGAFLIMGAVILGIYGLFQLSDWIERRRRR